MAFRICTTCFVKKPVEHFSVRDIRIGRRHRVCKMCHKTYRRKHYLRNKEKYIKKARRWNGKQRKSIEDFLFRYLSKHPCIDCGEGDVVVLDFDHRYDKRMAITQMMKNCYALETIKKEIKKCEVRCANCHRRRTAIECGYWKIKRQLGP